MAEVIISQKAATASAKTIDDLDRHRRRLRAAVWGVSLVLGLMATIVLSVGIGPVGVAPGIVVRVVGHHILGTPSHVSWSVTDENIVWLVRTPRVLLGAVVGAGLALCGVALQALVRNMLADPFLLGVSSGASTGATAAILFGFGASLGINYLSICAFLGALAATAIVFLTARISGRVTPIRLVLAGVAVAYALSAVSSFLIFAANSSKGTESVVFWLLGELYRVQWSTLSLPAVVVVGCFALLIFWSRNLDALAIGDDTALTLGTNPSRARVSLFIVVSICVGALVAVSGTIAFVGLVLPHLARRLVGGEHRQVLIVSALLGAIFLVWCDVVARTAFAPAELPIGIVTAIIGTPALIVLVRRFHSAAV